MCDSISFEASDYKLNWLVVYRADPETVVYVIIFWLQIILKIFVVL